MPPGAVWASCCKHRCCKQPAGGIAAYAPEAQAMMQELRQAAAGKSLLAAYFARQKLAV